MALVLVTGASNGEDEADQAQCGGLAGVVCAASEQRSPCTRLTAAEAAITAPFIDIGGIGPGGSRCEVRLELGAGMVLSIARG